jgi:hypothetical protein
LDCFGTFLSDQVMRSSRKEREEARRNKKKRKKDDWRKCFPNSFFPSFWITHQA